MTMKLNQVSSIISELQLSYLLDLFHEIITFLTVISENYGERDSPDQIVPNKRQFTFSTSTHSLLSKEISSTTSSSTIDTPIMSPALPAIREHEPRKADRFAEVNNYLYTINKTEFNIH